jgi:competence ComEA-like helix-hairpin-helix protein
MKATSPLEGDFLTDELQGGPQQEDVEIPAWLAGYTEEELAEQERLEEAESVPEVEDLPEEEPQPDAQPGEEEYGWFSAEHSSSETSGTRIDVNKAAISQLESIIGISYQVAKGIVSYREKHGPYQSLKDLLNVPEIQDDQTIEILKPEIIIHAVEPAPDQIPAGKSTREKAVQPGEEPTAVGEEKPEQPDISAQPEAEPAPEAPAEEKPVEESLSRARQLMKDGEVERALNEYEALIENGDQLDEVITDLKQASLDHPVNVLVMKTLGDAYMQQDQLQEALDAYSKAEELLR